MIDFNVDYNHLNGPKQIADEIELHKTGKEENLKIYLSSRVCLEFEFCCRSPNEQLWLISCEGVE